MRTADRRRAVRTVYGRYTVAAADLRRAKNDTRAYGVLYLVAIMAAAYGAWRGWRAVLVLTIVLFGFIVWRAWRIVRLQARLRRAHDEWTGVPPRG